MTRKNVPSTCLTCGKDFLAFGNSAGKYCSTGCANQEKSASEMLATELQLAWIAGILEGEGTFRVTDSGSTIVSVEMTDLDVLQRLQSYLGFGTVGQERKRGNNKTTWTFQVSGRADVEQLLTAILPHMSMRRTKQIATILGYIQIVRKVRNSA